MQTSILWEGSLPSKEEIEHMKREGYQFRSVDGGWKICLKLHNTPTGRWFADSFSKSFSKEVELHRYLEQVEKHAIWFEVPSKKLRVYEVGQLLESPKGEDECICMEVLKDTKNHSHLLLKTDKEEVYQLGSSAISTLENRARISGAALSNVRPAVLAEILNQCLKVAKGKALRRNSKYSQNFYWSGCGWNVRKSRQWKRYGIGHLHTVFHLYKKQTEKEKKNMRNVPKWAKGNAFAKRFFKWLRKKNNPALLTGDAVFTKVSSRGFTFVYMGPDMENRASHLYQGMDFVGLFNQKTFEFTDVAYSLRTLLNIPEGKKFRFQRGCMHCLEHKVQ